MKKSDASFCTGFAGLRNSMCFIAAEGNIRVSSKRWVCVISYSWWLQALAKRTRKVNQVFDSRSTCVSFGHLLAWTCIDSRRLAATFGRALHCLATDASRYKLIASVRGIYGFLQLASRSDLRIHFATLVTLCASSSFPNLRRLASIYESVGPGLW